MCICNFIQGNPAHFNRSTITMQQLYHTVAGYAIENGAIQFRSYRHTINHKKDIHGADFLRILMFQAIGP